MMNSDNLLDEKDLPSKNLPLKIRVDLKTKSVDALIDSGAEISLIKSDIAEGVISEELSARSINIQGAFAKNITRPDSRH